MPTLQNESSYHQRLSALLIERGALCVGIDPHPQILQQWGLSDDADGVERCSRTMVEALGDVAAVFKPQVALFECHGSRGMAVLERLLADIRVAGALSIADVKRGDIGSTMAGYARAWLSDDSTLRADAMTVSPYLGFESLRPALDLAQQTGRGVYVLARTSNPEGDTVQLARDEQGAVVAQLIVDAAQRENAISGSNHVGLVVGATHDDLGVDLSQHTGSLLVPGIGFQGGRISDIESMFTTSADRVLPAASRAILAAGPSAQSLREAAFSLIDY